VAAGRRADRPLLDKARRPVSSRGRPIDAALGPGSQSASLVSVTGEELADTAAGPTGQSLPSTRNAYGRSGACSTGAPALIVATTGSESTPAPACPAPARRSAPTPDRPLDLHQPAATTSTTIRSGDAWRRRRRWPAPDSLALAMSSPNRPSEVGPSPASPVARTTSIGTRVHGPGPRPARGRRRAAPGPALPSRAPSTTSWYGCVVKSRPQTRSPCLAVDLVAERERRSGVHPHPVGAVGVGDG